MEASGIYKCLRAMVKAGWKIISFKMASIGAVELLLQHINNVTDKASIKSIKFLYTHSWSQI